MSEFITLNKNNCKNCYKCIRNCPVKSIKFSGNQASVVNNECILCGHCYVVCPQNAKEISSDLEKAKVILQQNDQVIASLAPSFIANYDGANIESMKEALGSLGFSGLEETALGAQLVKSEYEDFLNDFHPDVFITSACHSVNLLIQKYYPSLLKYLAPTISPMQAHAMDIKKRHPQAKVIFIGPCIAKKDEAEHYEGIVDCVLTYEELSDWLIDENIQIKVKETKDKAFKSRFFPTAGGIIKSLQNQRDDYHYIAIDGVENCINTLDDIKNGGFKNCFIEMSSCQGSCINGPVMQKHHRTPLRDYLRVMNYGGKDDLILDGIDKDKYHKTFLAIEKKLPTPSDFEIVDILKQMGKHELQDELNCGSCGYNTCRDKAIAIYQGKADLSMCLPFLKERAESFYHNILNHTPSGIMVLNENLEIQQINNTAKRILNIRRRNDVLGEHVNVILNEQAFIEVIGSKKNQINKQVFLAQYNKHVKETIIYDESFKIVMVLMDDVTEKIHERKGKLLMNQQTIEVTDQVVEKQMRIVQEIASLLGETAAETKIALTKLKEQILDE